MVAHKPSVLIYLSLDGTSVERLRTYCTAMLQTDNGRGCAVRNVLGAVGLEGGGG